MLPPLNVKHHAFAAIALRPYTVVAPRFEQRAIGGDVEPPPAAREIERLVALPTRRL